MRKTTIMLMAIAAIATMVIPVLAEGPLDQTPGSPTQGPYTIPTSTDVTTQSGVPPIVKAKWETTSLDGYTEDDMAALGTQVDPTLMGFKTVYYWVVVTDAPLSDITNVWVDVKHPDGTMKYQFQLPTYLPELGALELWEDVYANNPSILTYNSEYDYSEIWDELYQGIARIYYGEARLSYCQPAGLYCVEAIVYDQGGLSGELLNHFWYVPTVGVDYDFTEVDYDHFHYVYIGAWNQLDGDTNFGTVYNPTVRVTGNVPVFFNVTQDDMGFNWSGNHLWNVHYKARLGGITSTWVEYDPYESVVIPGHLPLCTVEKFDFQIFPVKKWLDATSYVGDMTLWAIQFGYPPYYAPEYNPGGWIP